MAHFRAIHNAVFHQRVHGAKVSFLRRRPLPGVPCFGLEFFVLSDQRVCMLRHALGCGIKQFPAKEGGNARLVRARQGMMFADIGAEQGAPGRGNGVVRQGRSPQIHGGAVGCQPLCGIRRKGRAKTLALF